MSLLSRVEAVCPAPLRPILNRVKSSPVGKRIASGAFWLVLGNAAGKGLTFLSMVLVARILGPKAFGEFGLIKSTALTFVAFSAFGMGLTATKYIAELLSSDKDRVGRIIGLSYIFTCFSSLLVASVFWFASPWICESWLQKPHLTGLMQLGAVLLFLTAFASSQQGVLSGFQDFRGLAFSHVVSGATMMPIYAAGAHYWGLTGAVVGAIAAAGLSSFINSTFIYRNTKHHNIHYWFSQAGREIGVLGRFSLPFVLSSITYYGFFWGCQIMLGTQQDGAAQLGIFYAAFAIFTVVTAVLLMICQVYIAALSELFGKGDMKLFRKTAIFSFLTNVSIGIILALPLLCFPSLLMTWFFGESFQQGGSTLAILGLATFAYAVCIAMDQVLISAEKCWAYFGCCLTGAAVILLVTYLTVETWGSFGLSLALLSGFCTRIILLIPMRHRALRDRPAKLAGDSRT